MCKTKMAVDTGSSVQMLTHNFLILETLKDLTGRLCLSVLVLLRSIKRKAKDDAIDFSSFVLLTQVHTL